MTDIPAAWFPDPAGTPALRWWDGTAWTEHLAMPEPVAPVATTPYAPGPSAYVATAYAPSQYVPGTRTRFDNVGSFRTPNLTYTAAVWWVALTPIWFEILVVLAVVATVAAVSAGGGIGGYLLGIALIFGGILFSAGMAMRDRRQLIEAGYQNPASAWWWLLTPLAYLIARGIYMYRQKQRGWAPAITLGAIYLASLLLNSAYTLLLRQTY